jgi:L-glyceraldehyde 3-phosphate reductase
MSGVTYMPRMTSLVVGASSFAQLDQNIDALASLDITDDELAETERYATESSINLWDQTSEAS